MCGGRSEDLPLFGVGFQISKLKRDIPRIEVGKDAVSFLGFDVTAIKVHSVGAS